MLQAGIIGMGWWGQMLLKAGAASGGLRFVHGVSLNEEAGRPIAERHGIRFSGRVEDMFQDSAVQAVVIATPPANSEGMATSDAMVSRSCTRRSIVSAPCSRA